MFPRFFSCFVFLVFHDQNATMRRTLEGVKEKSKRIVRFDDRSVDRIIFMCTNRLSGTGICQPVGVRCAQRGIKIHDY